VQQLAVSFADCVPHEEAVSQIRRTAVSTRGTAVRPHAATTACGLQPSCGAVLYQPGSASVLERRSSRSSILRSAGEAGPLS
jgi:hypothetical protein